MNPIDGTCTRRDVLRAMFGGTGSLLLAGLLADVSPTARSIPLAPEPPHFAPRPSASSSCS